MPYAIMTIDKADSQHIRVLHRAAHYEHLKAHKHLMVASGGLLEDDEGAFKGGLIIVDLPTRESAQTFIDNDPFSQAGLFESVRIERMRVAFLNGEVVQQQEPRPKGSEPPTLE